jgi:bifunctional polynucleotide phosphatase/kinase
MQYIAGTPNLKQLKIAAFDLDDTIIKTKSGRKFPKTIDDWIFLNEKVVPTIQELNISGYLIMIISNKKSISIGKMTVADFESKLEAIYKALETPFICLYAPADDIYRKPRTGLWDEFLLTNHPPTEPQVNLDESFYCGDAAGRPRDFADTDYKFAINANLPFKLPLQVFGSLPPSAILSLPTPYPPSKFLPTGIYNLSFLYDLPDQTVIVMTGSQASGKSTITNKLKREGFNIVSQDTLKTPAKCKKALKAFLTDGENVVIDNTNPTESNRKIWIDIAKEFKVPHIVSIHMTTPKPTAMHLNTYRNLYDTKKDPLKSRVPVVAIHSYFKRLETPSASEGFTTLVTYDFQLDLKKDNKRIKQYMT